MKIIPESELMVQKIFFCRAIVLLIKDYFGLFLLGCATNRLYCLWKILNIIY